MALTVDTHHHMLPDFFFEATNEKESPVGGLKPQSWTPEASLAFMDEAGIDVAILLISTPGVQLPDKHAARELARKCNELAASLVSKYPRRFGAFASVPMPDVYEAVDEMTYAFDVLNCLNVFPAEDEPDGQPDMLFDCSGSDANGVLPGFINAQAASLHPNNKKIKNKSNEQKNNCSNWGNRLARQRFSKCPR